MQDSPQQPTSLGGSIKNKLGGKLLGPAFLSLAIKVSGAGLSYLMFVAFARLLPPAEYGAFAFSFNFAIVVSTLIGCGFATAIMRYWPKHLANQTPALAKGALSAGLKLISAASLLLLLVSAMSGWIPRLSTGVMAVTSPISIALLAITFAFADYLSGALRAQSSVVLAMAPRDIAWRILAPLVVAGLAWAGFAIGGGTAAAVTAVVLALLLVPQFLGLRAGTSRLTAAVTAKTDWSEIRSSLPSLWGASVIFAMIQQFDVVVVGYLMDPTQTGAYFAAQKTAALLSLVLIAGGLVAAPSMASLFHQGKREELQRLNRQLVAGIAVATFLGLAFLIVAGKPLLALFNPAFVSAYSVLIILALGFTIDALSGPTAYLMQMTAYESAYLKIMAACYLVVLGLQLILLPRFGGMGAAAATACGTILWNISAIWVLRKKAGLDPSILGLIIPTRMQSKKS